MAKKKTVAKNLADIPPVVDDGQSQPPVGEIGTADATGKLKQTEIPGTERPSIPELDEQADLYVSLRDIMQQAVKNFKEKGKTPLIDLMHKFSDKLSKNGDGAIVYVFDGKEVILTRTKEVLKVQDRDDADDVEVGAPADDSEGD
jgi:hypothetical protein